MLTQKKRWSNVKKCAFLLCFLCVLSLSISGCRQRHSDGSTYRAVTQIDIVTKQSDQLLRRHYTDAKKMQYVLTFLRLLEPVGKPDIDPETLTEDMFLIALTRSDGSRVYYRQTGHRYVCKDSEHWFSIDPMQAVKLYELMANLPSDQLPKTKTHFPDLQSFANQVFFCKKA